MCVSSPGGGSHRRITVAAKRADASQRRSRCENRRVAHQPTSAYPWTAQAKRMVRNQYSLLYLKRESIPFQYQTSRLIVKERMELMTLVMMREKKMASSPPILAPFEHLAYRPIFSLMNVDVHIHETNTQNRKCEIQQTGCKRRVKRQRALLHRSRFTKARGHTFQATYTCK